MATLTTVPVSVPKPTLTTPQILSRTLWAVWVLDIILLIALLTGGRIHWAGVQMVRKDAVSIISTQRTKSALADMDANAANELLGEPGQTVDALQTYETHRQEASKALIAAAQHITDDIDRDPILRVQLGLGTYEARIQRARDLRQERNGAWVAAYSAAADLIDREVLPEADVLDKANLDALNRTYESQHRQSIASRGFIVAAAAVTLAVLAFVQLFLTGRTHRLINPPLLLATGLTVGVTYYCLHELSQVQNSLKIAKEDALVSIHALWRARAVAYAAKADESRYLLDRQNAAKHEQEFLTNRDALVQLPREREAAIETLAAFGKYLKIDGQIRALERSGHHQEAIALCTGTKPGESNWTFEQFDNALNKTLTINQTAFDSAVKNDFATLAHFDIEMSVCAVLIGVLTLLGLMQRIREYQ